MLLLLFVHPFFGPGFADPAEPARVILRITGSGMDL